MNKTFLLFLLLFIFGVLFRLWLIHLVPQPVLIGDQYDYNRYAIGILHNGLFALSSRLYGYPLFLSIIYGLFGEGNTNAVIFFQVLLDCSTAFLIFWITQKLFNVKQIARIALLLYLFNPFTSGYSGLILTEVLTVFLMTAIFGMVLLFLEKRSTLILFIFPFLLGFLPQVRPPFLFFTVILLFITVFLFWKKEIRSTRHKVQKSILVLGMYLLPFVYTIIGNKVYFNQLAPLAVDNIFVREFYISMFIGRSPAHGAKLILYPPMYMFPEEVKTVYMDIAKAQNAQERKIFTEKYFRLAIDQIMKNPQAFIISHVQKLWYVWEKHYIFYYFEPLNNIAILMTYWGNAFLILLALLGLYFSFEYWTYRRKRADFRWFSRVTLLLFSFISILHTFSLSEERYSLPAYPLIFIFASFTMYDLIKLAIKKFSLITEKYARNRK